MSKFADVRETKDDSSGVVIATREDGEVCFVPEDPANADYSRITLGDPETKAKPLKIEKAL